jgi:diguanylate cyclase (GGDEF)-like protein
MNASDLDEIDPSHCNRAIQIADRIWWVGHYLPGDPFQCHTYLVEHGDQSVLIDPGSKLTFSHSLRKIESVVPFSNIRYFLCHHQDPDITGCLSVIDELVSRNDAVIVSHWRAIALLKHYGLKLGFWCVEKNGWILDLGGRRLDFIFTPYLHFPGAYCTFDPATGVLFSSDLFGAFTDSWRLIAADESHFESIRPFHEHYMPAREILCHGLARLENYNIKTIAPQHGSIIPQPLVGYMFTQLKQIDCGLHLMVQTSSDVQRLSQLNQMLKQFLQIMVRHRDFAQIAQFLFDQATNVLGAHALEFYCWDTAGQIEHLTPENRYRGIRIEATGEFCQLAGIDSMQWKQRFSDRFPQMPCNLLCGHENDPRGRHTLVIPLFSQDSGKLHAMAVFILGAPMRIDAELAQILDQMRLALSVAVEREMRHRVLDSERQRFYEISIKDSLTGLHTRTFMLEAVQRMLDIHDREPKASVTLAVFDIDHFKAVNDTFGHNAGDVVLKRVAEVLLAKTRRGDIAVRMGGEEFAVFLGGSSAQAACGFAARIRQGVSGLRFDGPMDGLRVTLSCGIAQRGHRETLSELLERADKAMYESKQGGRDRVCIASV